mmetsp:Transcript_3885/g.4368  ORF Transcript_3885/g.4368 Transcript_3885/m.4368 type:complete len:220 (-) Transcript_3885:355-1014(-)|eukprot:CAMPEP_0197865828 /NCGR_PEP_ID=MMETSP1438-20131217/43883_1 /TAXON_ID=1461541 /ORGANISM="Pterosperma sp., Strain CCMP1384" /LENGTH=219 /DNA_ID=CAMNT_0043484341 /DNA_START=184 /DNA_END=843 /DNA_ORIENTATION=-
MASDIVYETPAADDIRGLAEVGARAFTDKQFRCFCGPSCFSIEEDTEENLKAFRQYVGTPKFTHCHVARDRTTGKIVGACQLQLHEDVGDLRFPTWSGSRHHCDATECYIEWIGVDPAYSGKGIGSKLLAWAVEFATEKGCTFMSLNVVKGNDGARQLYERKGYVVKPNPPQHGGDGCGTQSCACCFIFCFMGCRYTGVDWMEKPLTPIQDGSSVQTSI